MIKLPNTGLGAVGMFLVHQITFNLSKASKRPLKATRNKYLTSLCAVSGILLLGKGQP